MVNTDTGLWAMEIEENDDYPHLPETSNIIFLPTSKSLECDLQCCLGDHSEDLDIGTTM